MKASLAVLAMFAGLSAPAAAQYGGSAPAQPPRVEPPRNEGSQRSQPVAAAAGDLRTGVECLLGRDAASFDRLFGTAPFSNAERREAQRLLPLIQRCRRSDDGLAASAIMLRGAAAEALLQRQFATAPTARAPALGTAPLLRPDQARTPAEATALAPTYAIAECTAASRQDLVRAYLATEMSSEAETAAFRALQPAMIACVPPGGVRQLGVDGPSMRRILAESLYRWSAVQRDGAASPFAAAPAAAQAAAQ